jgi:small subunit ribosomal protein S3Ae
MAAPKAKIVTKKKHWLKIVAPPALGDILLGETYIGEKKEAIGKPITVNIMNISPSARRQNVEVSFKVVGLHDDKAITEFKGYQIVPSAIKRLARRGKDKIDDSFVAKTSDGKLLRVKPMLVTRSKANGSVKTRLRKTLRQYIIKWIASMKLDDFVVDLISYTFQKSMHELASKIYPVSACELRWAHITTEKKAVETFEEEAKKPEEESEETEEAAEKEEKEEAPKESPESEEPEENA